jgi:hypothetical protein
VVARYSLAKHVFVCRNEGYIVVLDVRADRYVTLDAKRTAVLAPFLTGWPASESDSGANAGPTLEAVARQLLVEGWLLEGPSGKDATPVSVLAPDTEIQGDLDGGRPRIDCRAVFRFCVASVRSRLLMRAWPFARVLRRVALRKAGAATRAGQPVDMERARQLMDVFWYLRAFLFSHREECLRDSLAVLEFLAAYGIFPDWVFGVRARPFAAHCWVQYQGTAFNDTAEHAGSFTPIMVV